MDFSPLRSDPTQPLPPPQKTQLTPQRMLSEAPSRPHWDPPKEGKHFRLWPRLQRRESISRLRGSQSASSLPTHRPLPVLIQEVVEDLEEEEVPRPSRGVSPLAALLVWVLSWVGIGFGVRWLLWPEELSLPKAEKKLALVDLAQLPLIPEVGEESYSGGVTPPELALGLTTPSVEELQVEPLENVPNPLDSLQTPPSQETWVEKLAASLERPSQDKLPRAVPLTGSDPDSLGPNRGEGTFLVLTTYSGEESLAKARRIARDAFVKEVNGQKFVQVAAFAQLEYARYHAETLKNQGFNVTIVEQ
jgi:hypothetical protein